GGPAAGGRRGRGGRDHRPVQGGRGDGGGGDRPGHAHRRGRRPRARRDHRQRLHGQGRTRGAAAGAAGGEGMAVVAVVTARGAVPAAGWREAVRAAASALVDAGAAGGEYPDACVRVVERNGPYIVLT